MLLALAAFQRETRVLCVSSVWRAPALGTTGPDFINAVVKLETALSADDLKSQVLRPIEAKLGRHRSQNKNATRTIDLDILIFNDEVIDPHIWDYAHLAVPLAECFRRLISPTNKKTISQISTEFQKSTKIYRINLFKG